MGNDTLFADFPSVIPEIKKLYETSDEKITQLQIMLDNLKTKD